MPLFGAHMSIAGGFHRAIEAARLHSSQAVQFFTSSPNSWNVPPVANATSTAKVAPKRAIPPDAISDYRAALRGSGIRCTVAHDSYLINLASPDAALYRRSIEAFVLELERAESLGLDYLVTHPGAHLGSGEEAGLAKVAAAFDEIHARCQKFRVQVLLETTAGQGTCLGHRFEHLQSILSLVAAADRLGVCLDTCHVFAAGYALAPEADYKKTLKEFDRRVGLRRLKVFHINDSLKPLGGRVDRHAAIGKGEMGLEPFRLLVNDARFRRRPMILETPKEDADGMDMDAINFATLRELCQVVK